MTPELRTQLQKDADRIGDRLRVCRRAKNYTQEQLALAAGTNQAVIQKIENGKSRRPRCIVEVAAVLGVNPAWLQFGPFAAQRVLPGQQA